MPERPKGAVCKIAGDAYGGSNPPPPTVPPTKRLTNDNQGSYANAPASITITPVRVANLVAEGELILICVPPMRRGRVGLGRPPGPTGAPSRRGVAPQGLRSGRCRRHRDRAAPSGSCR